VLVSRVAALVLGAHRSGTSVTAGILARLGFALPRTLMPADPWNAEGYFESSPFHLFHDRMLHAAGTSWDSYTRVSPEWLASDDARAMRDECRQLLRSEFGDAPRFVLKDPRICRFVPFWLDLLDEEGIQAKAVLTVRPPFDVARSLRARDGLRLSLGALVWLRHVLDAEAATRTIPRTWVAYAEVLRDWRQTARRIGTELGEDWLELAASSTPDDGLVKEQLQHHSGSIDTSRVPDLLLDWVRRTEDALGGFCGADASARLLAQATLDETRGEFDRTMAPFGEADEPRYLEWVDTAGSRQAVARELAAERDILNAQRDVLSAEREVLSAERDSLRADLNRVLTDRDRLRTDFDLANVERSELAQELQRVEADAEAQRHQLSDAEAEQHRLSEAVARLDAQTKDLTAALDASRYEVQALRTSMSWRVTAPLRAVYRLVK
jgi:hypothetical protein